MANKLHITEAEYQDARDNYEGFCTVCNAFTRLETEPDADEYDCPECEGLTVVGAENALVDELFVVV